MEFFTSIVEVCVCEPEEELVHNVHFVVFVCIFTIVFVINVISSVKTFDKTRQCYIDILSLDLLPRFTNCFECGRSCKLVSVKSVTRVRDSQGPTSECPEHALSVSLWVFVTHCVENPMNLANFSPPFEFDLVSHDFELMRASLISVSALHLESRRICSNALQIVVASFVYSSAICYLFVIPSPEDLMLELTKLVLIPQIQVRICRGRVIFLLGCKRKQDSLGFLEHTLGHYEWSCAISVFGISILLLVGVQQNVCALG